MEDVGSLIKLIQSYKLRLKILEEKCRLELSSKDRQIEIYREDIAHLRKINMSLIERHHIYYYNNNVHATTDNKIMNESSTSSYNLSHAKFGGGFAGTGGTQTGGTLNDYSSTPNLSEAAAEIQQLLKQLEETNPTTTETEKMIVVAKAADEIKKNPTLKARVIGALKSGGTEAFKEAVDNPLVNVLVAIIEGWTEAD